MFLPAQSKSSSTTDSADSSCEMSEDDEGINVSCALPAQQRKNVNHNVLSLLPGVRRGFGPPRGDSFS